MTGALRAATTAVAAGILVTASLWVPAEPASAAAPTATVGISMVATPPGCAPGAGEADSPDRARAAIASAPVVFTGKILATRDQGRRAEVQIERVWKGGPLPRSVIVRGTYVEKEGVLTALDRTYPRGEMYLFMPPRGASPNFIENACAPSLPLTSELAGLAPADGGQPPQGSGGASFGGADKAVPLIVGAVGAAALAGLALVLRKRVRTKPEPHPG